jgi:hypothetical protein
MRRLLFFLLLVVASCRLVAIPYGQSSSAETLFSSSTSSPTSVSTHQDLLQHHVILEDSTPLEPVAELPEPDLLRDIISKQLSASNDQTTNLSLHHETEQVTTPLELMDDDIDDNSEPEVVDETAPRRHFRMDDHFHNKDGGAWGLHVPIEVTEDSTIVRRGSGVEKRGTHMGVVQIDCHEYQNVAWYQNCLRQAKGDYAKSPTPTAYWRKVEKNRLLRTTASSLE